LALILAACVSIGVGTFVAPLAGAAITKDRAQAQFIKEEVTEYNTIGEFIGQVERLTKSSTDAQMQAVSTPLARSIESFQSAVQKQSWPKKAKSQVQELASTATVAISDLKSAANTSAWRNAIVVAVNNFINQIIVMDSDLGLPAFVNSRYVDACQADGATVETAMAAFHDQHPSVVPTKALLTGKALGGPYLQKWPHNAPHYTFFLTASGELLLSAPSSAKSVPYRGPNGCFSSFQ
jgi:hypothetical protein